MDVVVRDSRGVVVRGLTKEDLSVTEDGRKQQINFFEAKGPGPGKLAESPVVVTNGNSDFTNKPAAAASDALNMILFDLVDTAVSDQAYAREQMLHFLQSLPPGHRVALFVLSDRLHMLQSFTGSSDLLARAAALLNPRDMARIRNNADKLQATDYERYLTQESGRLGGRLGDALATELAREDAVHLRTRMQLTADAFGELARATSGYRGRKSLFWLAGEFPPATVASLHSLSPNDASQPSFVTPTQNNSSSTALSDSQIAVYPISVLGVETDVVGPEQSGIATGGAGVGGTFAREFFERQQLRSIMNAIARDTGGQAIYGTNDLSGALRRSLEDGQFYYQLAYRPDNQRWNGQYRQINVKAVGRGYSLSFRHGYFAFPEPPQERDSARLMQAALQPEAPESTTLLLKAKLKTAAQTNGAVEIIPSVDSAGIAFTTNGVGRRQAHVLLSLIALKEGDESKDQSPQTSGVLTLDFTPEQYRSFVSDGLLAPLHLSLQSGRYRLRLGVMDMATQKIGTLDIPTEIP